MTYEENNIFAKILNGDIPCDKVYEDEYVLAFRDIEPQKKIHVLVIPKGKYSNTVDFGSNASVQEVVGFYKAVAKIAKDEGLTDEGFRSIANTGEFGGQEVPHFHMHLLGGEPVGKMVG